MILVAAVLLAAGIGIGWAAGLIAAAVTALLAVGVVWLIANSRAHDDFFSAYANGRGLTRVDGKTDLPSVTPLLSKGDRRYAEQRFNGVLPGGVDGRLCLYTYEETSRQWLEHHSPEEYAFELVDGTLVCNVRGHLKSAAELDAFSVASAAVAGRLSEEAGELTAEANLRG